METIEKVVKNPCPSCGSRLMFSASKQLLACDHCGYTEDINRNDDEVIEVSLQKAVQEAKRFIPEQIGEKVVNCSNCGATYRLQTDTLNLTCPFCASQKVNLEAFEHNLIQPSGILPFQIPKKEAVEKYKEWIKKGLFQPSKLKKLAALEQIHGVYIPFWTYDADSYSVWSGEAGYYYYERQTVRVNGQLQTKEVRHTRWERKKGTLEHFFDDVLIPASEGLDNPKFQRILTSYRLGEVINFDPRLVVGWEAEIYKLDVDEGYEVADKIMDARIRGMCISRLGGDTYRSLNIQSEKSNQTFKHILLPVWICSYQYNNKAYQFIINGQTGRVGGEKPISWIKIVLTILIGLAIFALLFLVIHLFQGK